MVKAATSETNPSGGGMIGEGRFHFMIEDAKEVQFGESVRVQVEVKSIAGTVVAEIGKSHTEFFGVDGKQASRWFTLCVAAGLLTREQWQAAKDANQDIEINEQDLIGRTICGEIRYEEYQGNKEASKGKKFPQLGFNIWSPLDSKASDIPKEPTIMAMLGVPAGGNGPAENGASSPAAPAAPSPAPVANGAGNQPAAAPAAAGGDQWSGF